MATGAQSPQQTSPCRTTWQNILGQCHPKKHRKGKSYFLLDVLQKQITGPHCFLSGAGVKYQRITRNTFGYGWGRRAPGRISSRPQEPTLINSLFFLTSPTFWQLLERLQRHRISSTARARSTRWAVSEGKSISWHLLWICCSSPTPPPIHPSLLSSSPSITTCPQLPELTSKSWRSSWRTDDPTPVPVLFLPMLIFSDVDTGFCSLQCHWATWPYPSKPFACALSFACPSFSYQNHRLEHHLHQKHFCRTEPRTRLTILSLLLFRTELS